MNNEVTQSMNTECNKRLDTLYRMHGEWINNITLNMCKNKDVTEEVVSDLYLYLAEKCNPKLFYKESYNLHYIYFFLKTRSLNLLKRNSKVKTISEDWDVVDEEYDIEWDNKVEKAYEEVKEELQQMKKRKGFANAMIYEHYWFSEKTLEEVSKDIGISKSTTFLAVKKVKKHLKNNIQNPFE
jgi:DNA-directed RNA polymerase specialized sigma24 family protein